MNTKEKLAEELEDGLNLGDPEDVARLLGKVMKMLVCGEISPSVAHAIGYGIRTSAIIKGRQKSGKSSKGTKEQQLDSLTERIKEMEAK